MQTPFRHPTFHAVLFAACISLTGAHAPAFATTDFPIAVEVCPKKSGREPLAMMETRSCGVWSPDDFAATPSWNALELMAIDGNALGGGVVATLKCMSRKTGAVSAVAVVSSLQSSSAKKASASLPAPLDFRLCAYFVNVVEDNTKAAAQALMVTLRN